MQQKEKSPAKPAEPLSQLFQNALEELGATTQHLSADTPYDDILAEALDDKMTERRLAQ